MTGAPGDPLPDERVRIRTCRSADLTAAEVAIIRELLHRAFGDDEDERFSDDDWEHALGGLHVVVEVDGRIVGHAAVVARTLEIGQTSLRTGYVEAVAIDPGLHGRGAGSRVMTVVDELIRDTFQLGALGTGRHAFYERLGWRTWLGPSSVRSPDGERRTPDEDGYILVLTTPSTPLEPLDLTLPIRCDWRVGDVW